MNPVAELAVALPRRSSDTRRMADVAEVYRRKLADIPNDLLAVVCDELIATEDWFPTIARIRAACAEHVLALPNEGEALAQIEQRMSWARQDASSRPAEPPAVHPDVQTVVDLLGGYSALRAADDPSVLRGQFGRLYRERRAAEVRDVQVSWRLRLDAGSPDGQLVTHPAVS